MPTVGNTMPTLMDVARRLDPQGRIDLIAEYLTRVNEVLEDAVWLEGNLPTGNMSTIRTGIPQGAWRRLNYGVPQVKSQTRQVTDTAGMLEAYSKIDKKLAMLNGNSADWRASEDSAIIEGMSQQLASTLFYGDTDINPERFLGLAPRFSEMSQNLAEAGINILAGDGTDSHSDCASIWLVTWSPQYCHFFYPKGSMAGITMEDLGQDTAQDATGNEYEILRTHYGVDVGLTVRNWQGIVRISNIRRTQLATTAATSNLYDLMTRALERAPNPGSGRQAFYCDRQIRSFLRRQIRDKANVNLTMDEVAGKRVLAFDGVPVRQTDALHVNEAGLDVTNAVNW